MKKLFFSCLRKKHKQVKVFFQKVIQLGLLILVDIFCREFEKIQAFYRFMDLQLV